MAASRNPHLMIVQIDLGHSYPNPPASKPSQISADHVRGPECGTQDDRAMARLAQRSCPCYLKAQLGRCQHFHVQIYKTHFDKANMPQPCQQKALMRYSNPTRASSCNPVSAKSVSAVSLLALAQFLACMISIHWGGHARPSQKHSAASCDFRRL